VQSHGLRQDRRGRLLVPVRAADGRLWGVQRVDMDGTKLFLKGAGTEGGHALIGGRPKPGASLLVAEGYATGATLHEATGCRWPWPSTPGTSWPWRRRIGRLTHRGRS
jgi:phage/plasmid primase-like uncharacterized protein